MAKKNHNLDNFFREQLSGYEAQEKKGNWQVLNHLLDARERKRKMAWRILFGSLFLVCLFSGYFIFTPGNKESSKATVSNKNSGIAISPTPAADSNQNHSNVTVPTSANENNIKETSVSSSSENKDAAGAQTNIAEAPQDNNAKASGEKSAAKQMQQAVQVTKHKKKNISEIETVKNEKHSPVADAIVNFSKKADAAPIENQKAGEEVTITPSENDKTGEKETTTPETKTTVNSSDETKQQDVTANNINVAAAETATQDSTVADISKDTLPKVAVKDTTKLKGKNPGVAFFNVQAGLNLYRTQSQTLTDERHVSPIGGIELMYPLSQRFSVGLGALYSFQGGYHLSDSATQVTYFLEKNVSQQVILIRKQHKLYVPLTLYYHVSERHSVSGGVQWSYLINTVGDYYETETFSGSTTQSRKDNVKGYMDGIKSSAFSLSIGYKFSVSKRFDISMRAIQELSDSYTSQYFNGINTEPTWSLQTFVSIKF